MTKEELKRKQYDTWNKYYQKHKSEINTRRKKVREEYKNKLSVAEKRIEELEKQIEEMQDAKCISCTDLGGMLLKITDLEKENAELKENYRKRGDIIISLERQIRLNIHSDKLTKAKEIIKTVLDKWKEERWILQSEKEVKQIEKLMKQAEQFLNGDGCPDTLCEDCTKEDCTVRKLGLVEK